MLLDIIQTVPVGTQWFITSDSWDLIPTVLASARVLNSETGEWEFVITEANRAIIQQAVEEHELGEQIVYMTFWSATNEHLFNSWDRLSIAIVNKTLGITADLIRRYHPTLTIYEE